VSPLSSAPVSSAPAIASSAAPTSPPASVLDSPSVADLDGLARALGTRLLRPGDSGYPVAAELYSPRFDAIKPVAVARCASAADVSSCLEFVRSTGTPVAARSGGHSYAGYSTTTGLVVDLGAMNSIGPGSKSGTARIGAGARLVDVYSQLAAMGTSIPAGSCPTVGITGLALGGGVGVVARKYGLTCDTICAVELVTPGGEFVRCDENNDADLFWAHRGGGGGNFGIVTALEFTTFPATSLTHFVVHWNWADAADAVTGWATWLQAAPDEVWSSLHVNGPGTLGGVPNIYASGVYVGSPAGLTNVLDALQSASKPFSSRSSNESSYLETMLVEGGCAGESLAACHLPSVQAGGILGRESNAARSDYIDAPLAAAGVEVLLSSIEKRASSYRLVGGSVLFDAYGGVINRVAPADTAFVHRSSLACLQYVAPWSMSAPSTTITANQTWLNEMYTAMRPYVSGSAYQNYIDADLTDWQQAYYGSNLARLMSVKSKTDPTNLLHFTQSIPLS
jgi:FAD/FMN-containing dehydrogenase